MELISAKLARATSNANKDLETFEVYIQRVDTLIKNVAETGARSMFVRYNERYSDLGKISNNTIKKIKKYLKKSGYRVSWINPQNCFEIYW